MSRPFYHANAAPMRVYLYENEKIKKKNLDRDIVLNMANASQPAVCVEMV